MMKGTVSAKLNGLSMLATLMMHTTDDASTHDCLIIFLATLASYSATEKYHDHTHIIQTMFLYHLALSHKKNEVPTLIGPSLD